MNTINKFDGDYSFLSNFYDAPVEYRGITYRNSEAAYQAQKTLDMNIRKEFSDLSGAEAKKKAQAIDLRTDWDDVKVTVMYEIVHNKFAQNPDIRDLLVATDDAEIVEGNYWNDTFWGVCNGTGKNMLGKILMRVRKEMIPFASVKKEN